jgi:hypothetical protein
MDALLNKSRRITSWNNTTIMLHQLAIRIEHQINTDSKSDWYIPLLKLNYADYIPNTGEGTNWTGTRQRNAILEITIS